MSTLPAELEALPIAAPKISQHLTKWINAGAGGPSNSKTVAVTPGAKSADTLSPPAPAASHEYKAVYVLLIGWKEDDLGTERELRRLYNIFTTLYGFQVACHQIASSRSYEDLAAVLKKFVTSCESSDTLLVVYYGGHGFLDSSRNLHWRW